MNDSIDAPVRRALTPAVAAAAAFALVAGVVSVAFVSARGGLQLPVAPTATPGTALASAGPGASGASRPSLAPTLAPTGTPASPTPTAALPTVPPPTTGPPTQVPSGPPDPLLALPACPGHPGCFEYTVRRGDSLSAVADRYGLLLWITRALNPEVTGASVIFAGQTVYLGHDPTARLDPCPDGAPCHLYVVRSGDSVSTIAGRYGLSTAAVVAINPGLDAGHIVTGQVLRLPLFGG